MPIDIQCDACSKRLRLSDDALGKQCKCTGCGKVLKIERRSSTTPSTQSAVATIRIPCPKCSSVLVCDEKLLGTKGQCKKCKSVFLIAKDQTTAKSSISTPKWSFNCPKCNQMFEGKKEMQGRRGKCNACGDVFAINLNASSEQSSPSPINAEGGPLPAPFESIEIPPATADPFGSIDLGLDSNSAAATNNYWQSATTATAIKPKTPAVRTDPTRQKQPLVWMVGIGSAIGLIALLGVATLVIRSASSLTRNDARPESPATPKPPVVTISSVNRRNSEAVGEAISKLKCIKLAFDNFHSAFKVYTFGQVSTEEGQPRRQSESLLSWRVQLLPFLNQVELYNEFKQEEPWDSPHNVALLDRMPDVYRLRGTVGNKTCMQVVQGSTLFFGNKRRARMSDLTDGLGNTILLMTVGENKAVPWTCPNDFDFDPNAPTESLGTLPDDVFVAAMFDDSRPIVLGQNVDDAKLLALLTPRGSEIVFPINVERESMLADGMTSEEIEAVLGKLTTYSKTTFSSNSTVSGKKNPSDENPAMDKAGIESNPIALKVDEPLVALQKIAMAFQAQEQQMRCIPQSAMRELPGGRLSWRVHLLPYLGEFELYSQFRFNEAWDGNNNSKLLEKIPDIYKTGQGSNTSLCSFAGPSAFHGNPYVSRINQFQDGPEKTILAMLAPAKMAKPWTKPDDFSIDEVGTIIEGLKGQSLQFVLCDGKTMRLPTAAASQHLKSLATAMGGEKVDVQALLTEFEVILPTDEAFKSVAYAPVELDTKRRNGLKKIVEGMFSYHNTFRRLPIADQPQFFDKDGKPFLSWRVHILPFLGEDNLYREFKLNEPWNSPDNEKLIHKMPPFFRDPTDLTSAPKTRYMTLTGPGTAFANKFGPKLIELQAGNSTIGLAIAGESKSVIWTQPMDLQFDPESPFECFGATKSNSFVVAKLDGAVISLNGIVPEQLFTSLVSPTGPKKIPEWAALFGWR